MKSLLFVLALVASVCFFVPAAEACPVAVAGVTTFAAPVVVANNHCAVQSFAVPSVAVLATPVVVHQHGVVVQKQRNVRVRSRTVTRVR